MLDFSVNFCVFAHFVHLEGTYVGLVLLISREGTGEGACCLVVLIKFIARVRHVLIHKVMTLVYMFTHTLK